MTPIEALLKIKQMFAELPVDAPANAPAPAPAEQPAAPEYKEYILKSGAKVKIDKLEVGGKVMIVDEMGNEQIAPAGEHELADGIMIVLDEAGMILEVKVPEVEQPEVEVEEDLTSKKIEEMQAEIDELKKKTEAQKQKMSEVEQKFADALNQVTDVVIGLVNTPSADRTEQPKESFSKHYESKSDKINRFLDLAKQIKK
jgi:hypothetical protein